MEEATFKIFVWDYSSSVEDWRRAQRADHSELPNLNEEQKEFARSFSVAEEDYARGVLAGQYGQDRLRSRGKELGDAVQDILNRLEPGHRVVAVLAEMMKERWTVRIQTPVKIENVHLERELVDDLLDYGSIEEFEKLRVRVLTALGRKEFIVGR